MRTLPAPVSVVCAVAILLAGVAGAWHERARATELRAQCLFADPEFDLAPVSRDRLTAVLEAHAAAHGWRAQRESDLGAPAKCPDGVLDQLHAAWGDDGKFLPFIAVALERNGRIDAALALLSDEIERGKDGNEPAEDDDSRDARFTETQVSRSSELGARLALRSGRHEEAVAFARTWEPRDDCGIGLMGRKARRAMVLGRALAALGRDDLLLALAEERWTYFDPHIVALEYFIELEASRAGASFEQVVERNVIPRHGEALGLDRIRSALAGVVVRRDAPGVDADNASALWYRVPDRVEEWLLAVGPEGRAALVARTVQSGARADVLCNALLDLGAPEASDWIDRPTHPSAAAYERPWFQPRHARWRVLSGEMSARELLEAGPPFAK